MTEATATALLRAVALPVEGDHEPQGVKVQVKVRDMVRVEVIVSNSFF